MTASEQPSYITLDVEITSKEDLSPLEVHLKESTFILGLNKVDDLFFLRFEPLCDVEATPELSAKYIINLINALPSNLKSIWHNAQSKTFDFGFDSGNIGPQHRSILSPDTLKGISELGASVTITVYQYEQDQN
jgi:hypothetical protein